MSRQSRRGGGGVIIQDAALTRALRGIIYQLEGEVVLPPVPALRSVDELHATPSGTGGGGGRVGGVSRASSIIVRLIELRLLLRLVDQRS